MFNKFSEYMWHLIHYPLKAKAIASDIYILFKGLGILFDDIKEKALNISKQSNILTATGRYLDVCGQDRKMPRLENENDEQYRKRLIMKFEIAKRAGTTKGMIMALDSIGHDASITPMCLVDREKWAEFQTWIDGSALEYDALLDYKKIYNCIMETKPASAKPNFGFTGYYDIALFYGCIVTEYEEEIIEVVL